MQESTTTPQETFYQAVGTLYGRLHEQEGVFSIELEPSIIYRLWCRKGLVKGLTERAGEFVYLRCYPNYKVTTGELSFQVVCYLDVLPPGTKSNFFVLRGVYHRIPQSKQPIFTIYRNKLQPTKKPIEHLKLSSHIPLVWSSQRPYIHREDSEEKQNFYQIEARLLPKRGCFRFENELAPPVDKLPKRIRIEK